VKPILDNTELIALISPEIQRKGYEIISREERDSGETTFLVIRKNGRDYKLPITKVFYYHGPDGEILKDPETFDIRNISWFQEFVEREHNERMERAKE